MSNPAHRRPARLTEPGAFEKMRCILTYTAVYDEARNAHAGDAVPSIDPDSRIGRIRLEPRPARRLGADSGSRYPVPDLLVAGAALADVPPPRIRHRRGL